MEVKPIRHLRGEATRLAIMEAAESIFAKVGFDAARLEDVAVAVGIRRTSIIYYFANKQELYDAVEADIFKAMHHAAAKSMAHVQGPMARLLALLDSWLDFQVSRPSAAAIILRLVADVSPRHGNPTEFSFSALEDMEAVLAEGVAAGDFRAISPMMLINTVAGSALFYVCNGNQFGDSRRYDPADPATLADFRQTLHRLAKAAVSPDA